MSKPQLTKKRSTKIKWITFGIALIIFSLYSFLAASNSLFQNELNVFQFITQSYPILIKTALEIFPHWLNVLLISTLYICIIIHLIIAVSEDLEK